MTQILDLAKLKTFPKDKTDLAQSVISVFLCPCIKRLGAYCFTVVRLSDCLHKLNVKT